jgi:hypothetical protein
VIDLDIALEALVIPDSERGNKTEALSERISRFWCIDDPEPSKRKLKSFKSKVIRAYDVRSRIVHGGLVNTEDLKETRSLFDNVLRQLFCDFIEGRIEMCDPLTYWKPPSQEPCLKHVCVGGHCGLTR